MVKKFGDIKLMRLNEMLGIKYPIIQGAMANIGTGSFAAAASEAGGLGIISSGAMTPEQFKSEIEICKSKTDKPFGVNLMLMHPHCDELAQIAADAKVKVITTGAGNPSKYIEMWKASGALVFPVVPGVALAKRMEKAGVDAIIAEGTESGGHVGELTTMAFLPQVVNAVKIPVIAAGGIASGKQLLSAFALGAVGVQVGTCLLASEECPIHQNYKDAVLKAGDNDTIVTGRKAGVPVRILKNRMSREYLKLEYAGADKIELEKFTLGSLRKAVFDGDIHEGSLMTGQVAGMVNEIKPIGKIFEEMYAQYQSVLKELYEVHNEDRK